MKKIEFLNITMCDLQITNVFKNLSAADTKNRKDAVSQLIDLFKTKENLRNDIIINLLKNLGSVGQNGKEISECFRWVLESMDKYKLKSTIIKLKENLFLNKIKDATKGQLSIHKLGSILAFDALFTSIQIAQIDPASLSHFYKFVLSLIDDSSLGFLASVTIINFFKKISAKEFESSLAELNDELFSIDKLESHPQRLLFWISFTDDQKKMLKAASKTVPSIQSKEVLNKLPNTFKALKDDQLRTVLNYIATNQSFKIVWKHLCDLILPGENRLMLKQILLMAFEVVIPQPGSGIEQLTAAKRVILVNKIWTDKSIVNQIMKQLAKPELELHSLCQGFVSDMTKVDSGTTSNVFEQLFVTIVTTLGPEFVSQESRINQSARLSHVLLRHVSAPASLKSYTELVEAYFTSASKPHQRIYALEQLSAAFVRSPARDNSIVEILMRTNYQYNYVETTTDSALTEAARSALFRCLEIVEKDNLESLLPLLTISMDIYKTEELHGICNDLQQLWTVATVTKTQSKKRSASQRNQEPIDLTDKTNIMFVSLLAKLCFYMGSQPMDAEMLAIIDDINTCFDKFRGVAEEKLETNKRSKTDVTEADIDDEESEKSWTIVLSDVLIVLLEQSCHYLRTLSMDAFKNLVVEGKCDVAVIEHINATIERADVQARDIDKKRSQEDPEISEDEEASESDIAESEVEDVDKESDTKARIFAALGSMMVDVHSDSDDNCPVIEEPEESSDDENNAGGALSMSKAKVSLKEKRHTVLQLRQFRHRCIDLLDTVCQHSPKLQDRLAAFLVMLRCIRTPDKDIEARLIRSIQSFKKYQPSEQLSTSELISHINMLLDGVQKCTLTKNMIQILGSMMVIFLRMKKQELPVIVDSFRPIIEQCITEKKKNPLKAIFLETFESFPEISWAFYQPMLNYVDIERPEQVQIQAISILRKVATNPTIKNIVSKVDTTDSFVSKSDILLFVTKFGEIIRSIITKTDLQIHPKYSAILIGSLIDCLKLGGRTFNETIETELFEKLKGAQKLSIPRDLKKTIKQFVAAVDCAKKSVNDN